MATILERRELTPVTKLFVVRAPLVARNARPGQFVIVRVDEHGERVPISLTDFDPEAGTVTLVVQEVGKTSGLICRLEEGEEMLDLAGPLGQPAPLPDTGHAVLVGGGFGAGAVHPIARERIEGAGAEASADEHHVTVVGQRRGPAERADEVEYLVPRVERAEQPGRLADLLDDERDGAGAGVEVGQADRHALAVHVDAEDDELSRLRVVRDQRRVDDEERRDRGQLAFLEDGRHHIS